MQVVTTLPTFKEYPVNLRTDQSATQ